MDQLVKHLLSVSKAHGHGKIYELRRVQWKENIVVR